MLLADDARLDDRQTLVRLMTMGNPRVSSGCRRCIAATLANVFGGDALKEQLHIVTDMVVSPPLPSACLATLGQQLAATQAGKLKTLLENGVPISLSFGAALAAPGGQRLVISDVYVAAADGGTFSGAPVYTGLGTGSHLFRCDPDKYPRLWAVFAASDLADAGEGSGIATAIHTDQSPWKRCEGSIRIDMATGLAHAVGSTPHAGSSLVMYDVAIPMALGDGFGGCKDVFKQTLSVDAASGTLRFLPGTASQAVACWLGHFFGPQVSLSAGTRPHRQVELPLGLAEPVHLISDLIVPAGVKVTLLGHNNTLNVGKWQIRVSVGGELISELLTIEGSTHSPGIVVEGKAGLYNSTVRNCTAFLNVLTMDGLQSLGGGVYAASGSEVVLRGSFLVQNTAKGPNWACGGGLYASGRSSVAILDSGLFGNAALAGGGLAVVGGPVVQVDGSVFRANVALRADSQQSKVVKYNTGCGGGIYVSRTRTVFVSNSTLINNAADSFGGAVSLEESSMLSVAGTQMLGNTADNGGAIAASFGVGSLETRLVVSDCRISRNSAQSEGGGIYLTENALAIVTDSVVASNTVGSSEETASTWSDSARGGGIYVGIGGNQLGSSLRLVSSKVVLNTASAASDEVCGGGIYAFQSSVDIKDSEVSGNTVGISSGFSRGGGLCVVSGSELTILRAQVNGNRVHSGREASDGGALHIEASIATISDSSIVGNSAEQGRQSQMSRGGFLSVAPPSMIELRRSLVMNSTASSVTGEAFGGAVYAAAGGSPHFRLHVVCRTWPAYCM